MRVRIDTSQIRLALPSIKQENLEFAKKKADKIATDFHRTVKRKTPVDEGTARAGWDLDTNTNTPTVENNVVYVNRLNRGHSSQAPSGFIEAALDAAIARNTRS